MTDSLGHSENSASYPNESSGEKVPVQTHNTPALSNPEQEVAVPNDDSSDTRDGYVNIQNLPGASTENATAFLPLIEAGEQSGTDKRLSRKRILATTAIAASVIMIAGGVWWSSVSLSQQPAQHFNQAQTTTSSISTAPTTTRPYVPREFMPVETSAPTTAPTPSSTTEKEPEYIDRTKELAALSSADAEKIKQYKVLPHSFDINTDVNQQELVRHSCKGFDLWLRTNNEGNIADQIVGGGNTHSKGEVKQAFETFWAQTRAFLGHEFGQEGLPVLSCQSSMQIEKTTFNCNNSSAFGSRQDVVMNIAFVTPYGTPDNRTPIVQLHFKDITYCPAFNRNYGEDPKEAGVVVVFWKLPEVRMGSATIDTATWGLSEPKFDATTYQGKWHAPSDPNSFYTDMRSK